MYCTIDQIRQELALIREPDRTDQELQLAGQRACDLIDAYTGRHFRPETAVENHLPVAGTVLLSHWPVHSVVRVQNPSGQDTAWQVINAKIGEIAVASSGQVQVEYYYNDPKNPVPEEVARAAAVLAARIASGPPPYAEAVSSGQLSLDLRSNPLLSQELRWLLLRFVHRRRFL